MNNKKNIKLKLAIIIIIPLVFFSGCGSLNPDIEPYSEDEVLSFFSEATDRSFEVVSKETLQKNPAEVRYILAAKDDPDFTFEVTSVVGRGHVFYDRYIKHDYENALLAYHYDDKVNLQNNFNFLSLAFSGSEEHLSVTVYKYDDLKYAAEYIYKLREIYSGYSLKDIEGSPVWFINLFVSVYQYKEDEDTKETIPIAEINLISEHQTENEILKYLRTQWRK